MDNSSEKVPSSVPRSATATVVNREVIDKYREQQEMKREEEEKERGVISRVVYKFYAKSVGYFMCTLVILSLFLMQGIRFYYAISLNN